MLQLNRMFLLGVSGIQGDMMRDQWSISQRAYELMIEISWKFSLSQFRFSWADQVIILHMPQQLSCCGMCKIVTWLDHYIFYIRATYFHKIWIVSS